MPNLKPGYVNLEDAVPGIEIDFDAYRACERDHLTPALEQAGFEVHGSWHDGERDSFGPLSRCVRALNKDGDAVIITYG